MDGLLVARQLLTLRRSGKIPHTSTCAHPRKGAMGDTLQGHVMPDINPCPFMTPRGTRELHTCNSWMICEADLSRTRTYCLYCEAASQDTECLSADICRRA